MIEGDQGPAHGDGREAPAAPVRSGESATPAGQKRVGGRSGLLAVLGALAAWGGWFIFRTSLVVDGRRVFCLFDDAMISMTYARNLVEGHGLNWARQGAPVEGFTHPLWTALMVPVNLLPIGLDRRSLVVQLLSLALLLLHVALVRLLVLRHFTRPGARHWAPACVLTAFYYPLNFWSLIGMETALQAVLTTALVLFALDIVYGGRDRRLALLLVGTLAVLLRLDMALLVLAAVGYVLAHGGPRRSEVGGKRDGRRDGPRGGPQGGASRGGRRDGPRGGPEEEAGRGEAGSLRGWLPGVAVLVAATTGYGLFRWRYFHDLLPNTYYLKLAGIPLSVRLLRGGSSLLDTLGAHWPLLLAVGVGIAPLLPLAGRGGGRDRDWGSRLALPAIVFALCCAYSVYVGGDAWEEEVSANRFVAFAMPQVFVLFNALLNQALAWAGRRSRHRALAPDAAGRDGAGGEAGAAGIDRPNAAGGEASAALPLPLRYGLLAATLAALLAANGLWQRDEAEESWKTFAALNPPLHTDKYEALLGRVRSLRKIADPAATVAVVWAGVPAYFSDFRLVDTLGYNDRHIAHGKPANELTDDNYDDFVPGHVKWDYPYLLDQHRPDAFLQLWGGDEVPALLRERGYRQVGELWVDPSSPRIHLSPGARPAPS